MTLSLVKMFFVGFVVAGANMASAQNYPGKPVRILTSAPGGGSDFAARLIASGVSGSLGQQVTVDNRGGSVVIPAEIVAHAPPDGYTLLFFGSTLWLAQFLQDNTPYDVVRDFSPITLAVSSPNILVVHPSLPVRSVRELIALAKSRPGELSDAGALPGSPTHIATELFKAMARVNVVRIPYKGVGPAMIDLLGGQVQVMFVPAAAVAGYLKSGRVRALAVTSAQPSALFPGLPTVAASGLPGYESVALQGMFAPAKTPAAIISRLNQEIVRALNRADVKDKFLSAGVETVGSSPEQFAATIKSETGRLGKVIKDAGIKAD